MLVKRLATVNAALGELVIRLLDNLDDGLLRAADLRPVGQAMASLGAAIVHRADELDQATVIDSDAVR